MNKYKELLKSRRFQLATLVWASAVLEALITKTLSVETFFNFTQIYILAVVGVGTVDSIAKKIGGK